MDKLKRYAGYAGLGFLSGFFGVLLGINWFTIFDLPYIFLISLIGGIIGGSITKKWWGAFVGGIILSSVYYYGSRWYWG